jgi:Dimerisation domain of Zinc Transporter
MDEAVPTEVLARIKAVISEHGQGALEAHDVRTQHAGRWTFIDFHLVVPGEMRSHALRRLPVAAREDRLEAGACCADRRDRSSTGAVTGRMMTPSAAAREDAFEEALRVQRDLETALMTAAAMNAKRSCV